MLTIIQSSVKAIVKYYLKELQIYNIEEYQVFIFRNLAGVRPVIPLNAE